MSHDDDLRALLHDATEEVHPHGSFEDVRSGAAGSGTGGHRWWAPTLAAAAAVVLVIGGVAWFADQQQDAVPTAGPDPVSPAPPVVSGDAATGSEPRRTATVTVYYAGHTAAGPRLFAEDHQVSGVTGSDLQVAMEQAVGSVPEDPDYARLPGGEGIEVTATTDGATTTVNLSEPPARPSGTDDQAAAMAVQSLVWTADAATGTDQPVRFLVAGDPVDEVLGVPTSQPVGKNGADQTLAAVSIQSPGQGATVESGFTVTGQAATVEANVVWELRRGTTVVRQGFATAAECCTLSPYAFTVTAPPGDYTLVVHDTDESDGEGIGTTEDTKDLTLR